MAENLKSLGICVGASTLKVVELDGERTIVRSIVQKHECDPRKVLKDTLRSLNLEDYSSVTLTGRKLKDLVNLPVITEVEAAEHAIKHILRDSKEPFNALISLGGENFIVYELDDRRNIVNVHTGNKCASGTGEFFLQQIRRMNVGVEEAIRQAQGSTPYYVSGRCSVFCKSDCTHALNKGVPIGTICAGLGNMIAEKVLELLKSFQKKNILVVGGVTKNTYVMDKLKESVENLVVPREADIFEALGAAIHALENRRKPGAKIFIDEKKSSFGQLPALADAGCLVEFKEQKKAMAETGDECILGLDVGSTTTKAVLLRTKDDATVASVYLRTNGDPVRASRECYREIDRQLHGMDVSIIGLGVTGSGRQIAGLHALTDGIVNEIIAHATGATFFDKEVDTIIEIGGQDAKYTYLVNGVPCDYAMNEACSAGTGSFLEEASKESLDIDYHEIGDLALQAASPPNFNDQCAAFISSDIKNASHEGIGRENIVAGLVYSICMNYNNRVKGSRKIGEKIFMQGGVCYNRAVPLAMATLLGKKIVVPPDPGLIGAFGAALELKDKIGKGTIVKTSFSLSELVGRQVEYGESFACPGTSERCDLGCAINLVRINGRSYPFGGICNKYYNTLRHLSIDPGPLDVVAKRQELVFRRNGQITGKTIGLSKSFYTNMMHPLYYNFFSQLGMRVVLGESADPDGVRMSASSFCFPGEVAHGMFMNLLKKKPDYIFLPQVDELHVEGSTAEGKGHQCTCILAQSEPYYLRSAFREIEPKLISPVLDFSNGVDPLEDQFVNIAKEVGEDANKARAAFAYASEKQRQFSSKKKELGDRALEELEKDRSKIGVVVFGRAYNAFADETNLGIPRKFASRGVVVIPFDCLRYGSEESIENLNWATGQEIVKAARIVKRHPQLFGTYITNFSCGPDSFLVGYFRDIMKTKPSLTLELDSHTADAGINTRIEAFLDIIQRYRSLQREDGEEKSFSPAGLKSSGGEYKFVASDGREYSVRDKRVKMVIPSMGTISTELASAAFRGIGFNAEADSAPDFRTLMLGRANTSCKECLPLILTTASLLESIKKRKSPEEMLLYFMPTAHGNCRFSQYYVFQKRLIEKQRVENVALLTLTAENNYAGLGNSDQIKILKSLVVADALDDIRNALLVLALDRGKADEIFAAQKRKIRECFEQGAGKLYGILTEVSRELGRIEIKYPLSKAKKVLLAGEIYVRKDEFCSQEVILRLAKRDIVTRRSSILEWLYYVDHCVINEPGHKFTLGEWTEMSVRSLLHHRVERKVKSIFASSGLCDPVMIDMEKIITTGSRFINPAMTGEAIVVIGTFFHEMVKDVDGMISIGPFACMPTRVIEAILGRESKVVGNKRLDSVENIHNLRKFHTLPFLSIEADGNPFPQIVEARIEAFALQVERLSGALRNEGNDKKI